LRCDDGARETTTVAHTKIIEVGFAMATAFCAMPDSLRVATTKARKSTMWQIDTLPNANGRFSKKLMRFCSLRAQLNPFGLFAQHLDHVFNEIAFDEERIEAMLIAPAQRFRCRR
jgi:hypothetical protein